MQLNKTLDRVEQAVSQPAVVGAPRAGGYEVDVAFAHRCAVFCKGYRPRGAFALGKLLALAIGKTVALKKRHHRVARQGLHQVVAQPALVLPSLGVFGFVVGEAYRHARHQHRLAAQQMRELCHRQSGRLKIFRVGPDPDRGALFAVALALGTHHQ